MSKGIFINYRRVDSSGYTLHLHRLLTEEFGDHSIFMDVDTISPGEDFGDKIDDVLASCFAMISVIGPHWLTASDDAGNRRLDHPADFVRCEIEMALKRRIPIFPVLVNGAKMPSGSELPQSIGRFARRQALELRDARFDDDLEKLCKALRTARRGATDSRLANWANRLPLSRWFYRFKRWMLDKVGAKKTAMMAALVIVIFGWASAFDLLFGLQSQSETLLMWVGGLIHSRNLHQDITLIAVDQETRKAIQSEPVRGSARSWRDKQGELVEALAKAGARVIVFDFYFETDSDGAEKTAAFASAIKHAVNAGTPPTPVVLGAREFDIDQERFDIDDHLRLDEVRVGFLGIKGVGRVMLGQVVLDDDTGGATLVRPSLSLEAAAAYFGLNTGEFRYDPEKTYLGEYSFYLGERRFPFTETRVVNRDGEETHLLYLSIPIHRPKRTRNPPKCFAYQDVLLSMNEDERTKHFKDRVVIVGDHVSNTERIDIPGTLGWRYGMEVHASAINDLISGRTVRKPTHLGIIALALPLALASLFIGWRYGSNVPKIRKLIVLGLVGAFFVLALFCYTVFHFLIDPLVSAVIVWVAFRLGDLYRHQARS